MHAVIDNFSRRILAWTVSGHLDPLNTHAVLVQAASHLAAPSRADVVMDSPNLCSGSPTARYRIVPVPISRPYPAAPTQILRGRSWIGDAELKITRAYDVRWPLIPFARRVVYVLDHDHAVAAAFRHEFQANRHLDEVLRFARKLRSPAEAP